MSITKNNILIGSILGDGNLALYGRSTNAYYREHGCKEQNGYRQWKAKKLNYKFIEKRNTLRSKSLTELTKLHKLFYINHKKTITNENIKLLNHPVGLMCLYFDDGSLVIQNNNNKNSVYLFPRIYLYTQSFSKEENIILKNHLKSTFDVDFKLKWTPNGTHWHLAMNKRNHIKKFVDLIKPYSKNIQCMHYKVDLEERLNDEKNRQMKLNDKPIVIGNLSVKSNTYSNIDEASIIKMLNDGITQKEIAKVLNHTYYGIVDKIRRMKKEGKIPS